MSTLLRAPLSPSAEDLLVSAPLEMPAASRGRQVFRQPLNRFVAHQATPAEAEESLVADARGSLSPAQMVEQKLVSLLKGKMLPLSHMQSTASSGTGRRSAQS